MKLQLCDQLRLLLAVRGCSSAPMVPLLQYLLNLKWSEQVDSQWFTKYGGMCTGLTPVSPPRGHAHNPATMTIPHFQLLKCPRSGIDISVNFVDYLRCIKLLKSMVNQALRESYRWAYPQNGKKCPNGLHGHAVSLIGVGPGACLADIGIHVATTFFSATVVLTDSVSYLLMELTLGTFSWEHTASDRRRSRISQANIVGFSCLYIVMASTTLGVATFGFDPPITPGLMDPVS